MSRRDEIAAGLAQVTARIDAAVAAAGRSSEVQLLPVTKFHPVTDVEILYELGIREVGENREQEARSKHEVFAQMGYHMIGQIQSKKVNSVARWAHAVESVDSVALAEALDRGVGLAIERGDRPEAPLGVFVQLSLDGDPDRGGCPEPEIGLLAETVGACAHLRLDGLMCVPPVGADPDASYAAAHAVVMGLEKQMGHELQFSAGMSHDLEFAIAHGATIVRVGTDILGPRPLA